MAVDIGAFLAKIFQELMDRSKKLTDVSLYGLWLLLYTSIVAAGVGMGLDKQYGFYWWAFTAAGAVITDYLTGGKVGDVLNKLVQSVLSFFGASKPVVVKPVEPVGPVWVDWRKTDYDLDGKLNIFKNPKSPLFGMNPFEWAVGSVDGTDGVNYVLRSFGSYKAYVDAAIVTALKDGTRYKYTDYLAPGWQFIIDQKTAEAFLVRAMNGDMQAIAYIEKTLPELIEEWKAAYKSTSIVNPVTGSNGAIIVGEGKPAYAGDY